MNIAVTKVELRKRKIDNLVKEALELINTTNSKLRSGEDGKDKKRKQKLS